MKLIAIDVDGTLLPYGSHTISQENIEAIKAASVNNHISLCTGRCFLEAKDLIQALGIGENYQILGGGGLIKFKDKFSLIGSLPEKTVIALNEIFSKNQIIRRKMCISKATGSWQITSAYLETPMMSVEVPKWDDDAVKFENELKLIFPELLITHVLGHEAGEWWLQISNREIHKGAGLMHVKEKISATQTIAFGDALNDIQLFEQADISVVMSSAPAEVKHLATHEVTSGKNSIAEGLTLLGVI